MEFQFFLDTLKRRKWLLLTSMLLAGLAAFAVMSVLPPKYRANAQIKTGIIDYRGKTLERNNNFVQKWQVDNAFSNMVTNMQGRDRLAKLTELLLHHDLTSPTPFRQPDAEELAEAAPAGLEAVKRVLVSRADSTYSTQRPFASTNGVKLSDIAEAYEYDFDSLQDMMMVKRIGDTDFLDVSFLTEDPALSYFMVSEFVQMYLDDTRTEQSSEELAELEFYTKRVNEQKRALDSLQNQIDLYKRGKAVVDLDEQQRAVVGQLRDIENDIEERRKEIRGYENALAAIRADRMTAGRSKADRTSRIAIANSKLDRVKRELSELNERLSDGGDEATLRRAITRKKIERDEYIEQVATLKRLGESKVEDRIVDLEQQELEAEIELEAALKAVSSMQQEARRLRGRKSGLVNDEAYISQLVTELDLLRTEYNSTVDQRDEAEVIYKKSELPLVVVEEPEFPDEHESRHRVLVSAFSAISMGTLVALGLFLVTLFDSRLRNPDQLRTLYGKEAVATLTHINTRKFSLNKLFSASELPEAARRYIEGVRSLRFDIEQSGKQIIQITSLNPAAGKSMLTAGLATALTRANKRVLLLDLNFKRNTLSAYANTPVHAHPFEMEYDEMQLPKASAWFELEGMDIVGNMGGNRSLAEVLSGSNFSTKLQLLQGEYDIILMECAALALYADGRELAELAQGIYCVLDADDKVDTAGREAMNWLETQGEKFEGYVLNRVDPKMLS